MKVAADEFVEKRLRRLGKELAHLCKECLGNRRFNNETRAAAMVRADLPSVRLVKVSEAPSTMQVYVNGNLNWKIVGFGRAIFLMGGLELMEIVCDLAVKDNMFGEEDGEVAGLINSAWDGIGGVWWA